MARGRDDNAVLKLAGAILLGGAFIYLVTGRGKNKSPFLPPFVENPVDGLVESLNNAFGPQWVNAGLDALQRYIERTMPQLTALLKLVFWVEQNFGFLPGPAKKAAVLIRAR